MAAESSITSSTTNQSIRSFFSVLVILFVASITIPKGSDVLWINGHHTPLLDVFFKTITNLGDGIVFIPIAIASLFIGFRHFIALALSALIHGLIVSLFKHILFNGADRPRNFLDPELLHFVSGVNVHGTNTFPSGHTATAFCAAMIITLMVRNRIVSGVVLILALLIGYSRVYLAQHFLMDVAAGATVGAVTTYIIWKLIENNQMPSWMNRKLNPPFQLKSRSRRQSVSNA